MRVDINVVYLNLSFYLSLFFYECNYLHALFFLKVGFCFTSLTTVCMMIFFVTKFFLKCKIEIEKLTSLDARAIVYFRLEILYLSVNEALKTNVRDRVKLWSID